MLRPLPASFAPLTYSLGGAEWGKKPPRNQKPNNLEAVQTQLLINSPNICVIKTALVTKTQLNTILAAMRKINSIPARSSKMNSYTCLGFMHFSTFIQLFHEHFALYLISAIWTEKQWETHIHIFLLLLFAFSPFFFPFPFSLFPLPLSFTCLPFPQHCLVRMSDMAHTIHNWQCVMPIGTFAAETLPHSRAVENLSVGV